MKCSELNFVTSQCIYACQIAYPRLSEDEIITKSIRMAKKIILLNANPTPTTKYLQKRQLSGQSIIVRRGVNVPRETRSNGVSVSIRDLWRTCRRHGGRRVHTSNGATSRRIGAKDR